MKKIKNLKVFYNINRKTTIYSTLRRGNCGVFSQNYGALTRNQIKSFKNAFFFAFQKKAKIWDFNVFKIPVTKKPQAVRLGKGKGIHKYWNYPVTIGKLLFEMQSSQNDIKITSAKLPIRLSYNKKYFFQRRI